MMQLTKALNFCRLFSKRQRFEGPSGTHKPFSLYPLVYETYSTNTAALAKSITIDINQWDGAQ